MELILLASLLALGVAAALDGTSLFQAMLSRPFVAATLAGALVGSATSGMLAGIILELFFLPVVPVGGGRFAEGGPAGVVAGATAGWVAVPAGLVPAVLLGLVVGGLGGASIRILRRVNGRFVPDPLAGTLSPREVRRAHGMGLLLDALRGGIVTALGLAVAYLGAPLAAAGWRLDAPHTIGLLLAGAALPLGLVVANLRGVRPAGFLALGVGLGAGVLLGLVLP